jgi:Xaa-Pro aminopeptidase
MYISNTLIDQRHRILQNAMEESGYYVLIVVGNSEGNERGYIRYLSDWRLFGGTAYIVFGLKEDPVLIMGLGAQAEWAKELSAISDTRAVLNKNEELIEVIKGKGLEKEKFGAVGWNRIMPYGDATAIIDALPNAHFEDATNMMENVMAVLFDEEVSYAEETHKYVVQVLEKIAVTLKPGLTGKEVMAEAIHEAAKYGCLDGMAHMGCGMASKTMPGTDRPIHEDDTIKIFLEFAGPSGFLVELGGQFSFREPPEEQSRKFDTVVKAMGQAGEQMRPGAKVSDLCRSIRKTFEKDGWMITGRRLWDFHGQGLHSILPPLGLPDSQEILKTNSMINIHPGILTEDGIGISATHNYIVTPEGGRALGNFAPEWRVLNP